VCSACRRSFETQACGLLLRMRVLFTAILFLLPTLALAVDPDEILNDPALEARAREIGKELRCVTCQSQSIDDSNAPLAKDLRLIVRERLVAGDTNEEVIAFVTDRYGDYVRLKPAMRADTALLWLAPLLAFSAAGTVVFFYFRDLKQKAATMTQDDNEEEASEV
jgi:cytochrome c-type biogenesis protein CcmH